MKVVKRIPSPLCGEYVVVRKGKRYYWQWFAPRLCGGVSVFGSNGFFKSIDGALNDVAKELAWHRAFLEDEQ